MTEGKPGRPPERIRVSIRPRKDGERREVVWPKGWPLPRPGDNVVCGGIGGFVEYLEFNLDAGIVIVSLR